MRSPRAASRPRGATSEKCSTIGLRSLHNHGLSAVNRKRHVRGRPVVSWLRDDCVRREDFGGAAAEEVDASHTRISAISRASESCESVPEPVTPTVFATTGGTQALKKGQRGRARPGNYQQ